MHTPRSLVQNRCVLPNVRLKVERVCAFASIIPLFWKLGLALLTILPLAGTVRLAMVQSAESFFVVVGEAAGSRSPSRKAGGDPGRFCRASCVLAKPKLNISPLFVACNIFNSPFFDAL